MNHRHGAILQTVQLIQAARFVLTGHQKDVGTRLNLVGKVVTETKLDANLVGKRFRQLLQRPMIFRLSRSKNRPLHVEPRHQSLHHLDDQVPTLLTRQTPDQSHQWTVRLGKIHGFLQRLFALRLPFLP